MTDDVVTFSGPAFRDERFAGVFVATGPDAGEEVRVLGGPPRGFGSVKVEATIGSTTWRTSVFPVGDDGFVLPLKQAVRVAEGFDEGDTVAVRLRVLPDGGA